MPAQPCVHPQFCLCRVRPQAFLSGCDCLLTRSLWSPINLISSLLSGPAPEQGSTFLGLMYLSGCSICTGLRPLAHTHPLNWSPSTSASLQCLPASFLEDGERREGLCGGSEAAPSPKLGRRVGQLQGGPQQTLGASCPAEPRRSCRHAHL